ncbi:hypothetical protein RJT34_21519 [Clitoria ternatea]|uniref:Uncharacterized protein n=1 Tax=Clitoria ternatea TaxID=43366 RepID=A0AAN9IUC4_CLITE
MGHEVVDARNSDQPMEPATFEKDMEVIESSMRKYSDSLRILSVGENSNLRPNIMSHSPRPELFRVVPITRSRTLEYTPIDEEPPSRVPEKPASEEDHEEGPEEEPKTGYASPIKSEEKEKRREPFLMDRFMA